MILREGMTGTAVKILQAALLAAQFDPGGDDGVFGPMTRIAVERFQHANGLVADGIVGPVTARALGLDSAPEPVILTDITPRVTVLQVCRCFPATPLVNIGRNLPFVLGALSKTGLGDRDMVLMALAAIRAETAGFEPIAEEVSRWNTNNRPFDLYDDDSSLGNGHAPDGERFRGRGYVQLTGRANYAFYGNVVGRDLVADPDAACHPIVAGELLAAFLKAREARIRAALADNDLATCRRLVNGGTHGLKNFIDAYTRGLSAIPLN